MQNNSDNCRICLKVVDKKVLLVKTPDNYSKDYLSLLKECVPALEVSSIGSKCFVRIGTLFLSLISLHLIRIENHKSEDI